MNNRYAILVIDMLNDFINGKLRLDGVEDIYKIKYPEVTGLCEAT